MGWLDKIRGVVNGNSGDDQEWIAVDGVADTAVLLRVIEESMPRDAMVNIVKPRSAEVEGLLQQHKAGESNPDEGDYYLALSGPAIGQLSRLVSEIAPDPAFGTVLVTQNGRNLLEAYRRDNGEDVVWLSASLPERLLASVRNALEIAAKQPASPPLHFPQAKSA